MPKLSELLAVLPGAQLHLPPAVGADPAASVQIEFDSVSTDSRTLGPGALFVGLSGPRFDGAAFVAPAAARGAVAALLSASEAHQVSAGIPLVVVPDALLAMQQWARHWRSTWPGTCIAVTGSNGKTTVKQMIHAILRETVGDQAAWATPGNLNNHIGVPLSVLGLRLPHAMAVFELGMNHPDEIGMLADIARPGIALVNNAQREHQEFMKSVEAVARENGQVFQALPEDGVAIFPRDPLHEAIWIGQARTARHRLIRFGMDSSPAGGAYRGQEVTGRWQAKASGAGLLMIRFASGQEIAVKPKGLGEHFALNMIAAAACAEAAGCDLAAIARALQAFEPVAGRGRMHALSAGGTVVDDSYNANPDSVRAAIDALAAMQPPRALVLGDMGEVGDQGPHFHQEILQWAESGRLEAIWLHGDAFGQAHQQTGVGRHCDDIVALIGELQSWIRAQQQQRLAPAVWVKGSRFMKMERVVEAVVSAREGQTACC